MTRANSSAAPDFAKYLPITFDPTFQTPCFTGTDSATMRCLPAFFIAGGMQCGSDMLWRRLKEHARAREREARDEATKAAQESSALRASLDEAKRRAALSAAAFGLLLLLSSLPFSRRPAATTAAWASWATRASWA